jgi:hypothetical protein
MTLPKPIKQAELRDAIVVATSAAPRRHVGAGAPAQS